MSTKNRKQQRKSKRDSSEELHLSRSSLSSSLTHEQNGRRTQKRRKRRSSTDDEPVPSTSQANRNKTAPSQKDRDVNSEDFQENVNKCVRYILFKAGTNVPFRKSELMKSAMNNPGRCYQKILDKTKEILDQVYGYEMVQCKESAGVNKIYYLCNSLEYKPDHLEKDEEKHKKADRILLLFILSHIMMSNSPVSPNSVFSFLNAMKINQDSHHRLFGNIANCLDKFVKLKFLTVELNNSHKQITNYSWGPRATTTVSMIEVLKFVCKFYGNRPPESWPIHYAIAAKNETTANGEENYFSDDD